MFFFLQILIKLKSVHLVYSPFIYFITFYSIRSKSLMAQSCGHLKLKLKRMALISFHIDHI